MTLTQAIILAALYGFTQTQIFFCIISVWAYIKPLFLGLVTGIVLGDPVTGAVVGGAINLVYLGFISAGGSMPADTCLAGILGTAYAIVGGLDANTALAIAVPIGLLGTILYYARMTIDAVFVHMADRYIEEGKFNKLVLTNVVIPMALSLTAGFIPALLALYFGAGYVQTVIDMLGGEVLRVMQVIGGLMPALGIGITLKFIFTGEARVFLFIGFVVATYSGLGMLPMGVLSALVAIVYAQLTSSKGVVEKAFETEAEQEEEEF